MDCCRTWRALSTSLCWRLRLVGSEQATIARIELVKADKALKVSLLATDVNNSFPW
jgi:hypothetical protein